jgi:hypothetical protein
MSSSSQIPGECPYPEELGQAGWTVLHTAAAVFPNKPTPAQVGHFHAFITSWANVYACSHCAYHMRQMLIRKPPSVVMDKRSASRYVCELHNEVNEMLQKPTYNCDPDVVLRRWHPTYPEMADQPTPEEQLRQASAAAGGGEKQVKGGWRSWQASSSPSQGASSSSGSVADEERDSAKVMARLKGCQVYCPEKKGKE